MTDSIAVQLWKDVERLARALGWEIRLNKGFDVYNHHGVYANHFEDLLPMRKYLREMLTKRGALV